LFFHHWHMSLPLQPTSPEFPKALREKQQRGIDGRAAQTAA